MSESDVNEEDIIELEDNEEMMQFDSDEPDLVNLFQCFFASDDGNNIVDVLDGIKKNMEVQNKILAKMCKIMEMNIKEKSVKTIADE